MRQRIKLFIIMLFCLVVFFAFSKNTYAHTCSGGGSEVHTAYTCSYDGYAHKYVCNANNNMTYSYSCSGVNGGCNACVMGDMLCSIKPDGTGCLIYPKESGSPVCVYGAHITETGCWTCDDTACSGTVTTSQDCGSNTITHSCTNQCGGNLSWNTTGTCKECQTEAACGTTNWDCKADSCNECATCSPACGQVKDCGGSCATTDCGDPSAPTNIYPNNPLINPLLVSTPTINLTWSDPATPSGFDTFEIRVDDTNDGVTFNSPAACSATVPGNYCASLPNTTHLLTYPSAVSAGATLTPGHTYHWWIHAYDAQNCKNVGTCSGDDGWSPSAEGYFKVNAPPTISNLKIKNADGTEVMAEAGSRNHICQSTFTTSSLPRRVIFEATLTDADGWANISSGQLRWNGNVYNLVLAAGSGNSRFGTVTIDYTGVNNGNLFAIEGIASDAGSNSGWVDMGRNWKVWDCQVSSFGTIYDGSSGQVCPNVGFSSQMGPEFNLTSLGFEINSSGTTVPMTINSSFSYGQNNLTWGNTYLPFFNGGNAANPDGTVNGSGRTTRILDVGAGAVTANCPAISFNLYQYISAYSVSPQAQIDFSFIRDQEGWFQVIGAGVKSKGALSSGVPATEDGPKALTLRGLLADNGLVSYTLATNTNGCSDCLYGSPNDWYTNNNTNDPNIYSYLSFYNEIYVKAGIGVTGTAWAEHPSEGVFFVNGNLNIDSNFTLASGKSLVVIASGLITIDSSVSQLEGILIADGGIRALGSSDQALTIRGSLYSRGSISFGRSFTVKEDNNTAPAVVVNYDPALIFNLPGELTQVLSGWKEE